MNWWGATGVSTRAVRGWLVAADIDRRPGGGDRVDCDGDGLVALYGTGVLVKVPPPPRYAVHKLLIAQERRGRFLPKKTKDLAQARDLIDIFLASDPASLQDVLDGARSRGPKWKANINTSLRELGRNTRQGYLPLPMESAVKGKAS